MNCQHPTILPVPGLGGFGGYGSFGGAPVAPAAVGLTATQAMMPVEDKSCDILLAIGNARSDVKDVEAGIKTDLNSLQGFITSNQMTLTSKICDVEKEAIRNNGDIKSAILSSENTIARQIEMCCCDLKLQNVELKNYIGEKFCATDRNVDDKFNTLERFIDKGFDAIRERECLAREAALTAKVSELETAANNSTLINTIVGALKK